MPKITISLPEPHLAQWEVIDHRARFKVVATGRRFGKSFLGAGEGLKVAIGGGIAWWIAPTYKVAKLGWDVVRQISEQIPYVKKNETDLRLDFGFSGGYFQMRSGENPDTLRGAGLDLAVLDEAAYLKKEVWTEAIRPALSDRNGKAIFLSSPRGRNWFFDLYMLGQNPDNKEWKSWRFPTSANPRIPLSEIEDARLILPERVFQQEYLAEFLEQGGPVFKYIREQVWQAEDEELKAEEKPVLSYVFGVDWGKSQDFTVITVIERDLGRVVHIERFRDIGWSIQRRRLADLYEEWTPDVILAEANSIGGPNIEALQDEGLPVIPFYTTASSKKEIIEDLALAFQRSLIWIPNDETLLAELEAFTVEPLPSGNFRYAAPRGFHDDMVISLAIGWHAARKISDGIYL